MKNWEISWILKKVTYSNVSYKYDQGIYLTLLIFWTCTFLGRLVTGLVREFLEFFSLEYSLAVFDPESNFVSCWIEKILQKYVVSLSDYMELQEYQM